MEARIERVIADLDDEDFEVREKATAILEELGEAITPALRQALINKPSAEVRDRIQRVLDKLKQVAEGVVHVSSRITLSLAALEEIDTAEARKALEELAEAKVESRVRREAAGCSAEHAKAGCFGKERAMKRRTLVLLTLVLVRWAPALQAEDLKEVASFPGHKFRVGKVVLSPDGKLLVAGGGNLEGGDLRLWDVESGKEIGAFQGHHGDLFAAAFSPDGKRLAAAGYNFVMVWEVKGQNYLPPSSLRSGSGFINWALVRTGRRWRPRATGK